MSGGCNMSSSYSEENLVRLVRKLCDLPSETEWVEFKRDLAKPEDIGEYISALSNGAALNRRPYGYLVWGVENDTHKILGTTFDPSKKKAKGQPLQIWLLSMLKPEVPFRFLSVKIDGRKVVILEIGRASHRPVNFKNVEYIRVGEVKRRLTSSPERARKLWNIFNEAPFEGLVAKEQVSDESVLQMLDYSTYFNLLGKPLPDGRRNILNEIKNDRLIARNEIEGWDITNLGALLLAKNFDDFPNLKRKAVRVIKYRGKNRIETDRDQTGATGYVSGFERMIDYVDALLPSQEVIEGGLRKTIRMFPDMAVRELVANALIHQDFSVGGTGPMVEIFDDRIEITNPGEPLIPTDRFVDASPQCRNERLASLMRRFGICEEQGSGIDKVVSEVEYAQLPAPLFEVTPNATRSVLFSHKKLNDMNKSDRIRACYLHTCLKWVTNDRMTNSSLRERFGIKANNRSVISRIIRDSIKEGFIIPEDIEAGPKFMRYLPFWAAPVSEERRV